MRQPHELVEKTIVMIGYLKDVRGRLTWAALKDRVLTKTVRMELVFLNAGILDPSNAAVARGICDELDVGTLCSSAAREWIQLLGAQIIIFILERKECW